MMLKSGYEKLAYYFILPIFLPLFFIYVFFGWKNIGSTTFTIESDIFKNLFSFVMAVIAFFLTRDAALKFQPSHTVPRIWVIPLLSPYVSSVLVVLIGSFAFVSSMIYMFEAPRLVSNSIREMISSITQVEGKAPDILRVEEVETLKGNVQALKSRLHGQIFATMEGYCGIGPQARNIIADLNKLVPAVALRPQDANPGNPDTTSCGDRAKLNRIFSEYSTIIDDAIRIKLSSLPYRLEDRDKFIQDIRLQSGKHKSELDKALKMLIDNEGMFLNKNLYRAAEKALVTAHTFNLKKIEEIKTFHGVNPEFVPPNPSIAEATNIGGIMQIFKMMIKWENPLKYLSYVIIGIIVDVAVLSAIFVAVRRVGAVDIARVTDGYPTIGNSDVRLILNPIEQ